MLFKIWICKDLYVWPCLASNATLIMHVLVPAIFVAQTNVPDFTLPE